MSALSGGQEITSAFSRSLYYATPQIHPLSHVHTYTYTQTHTLNSCVSSHTSIKVYVCIYIFVYMCVVCTTYPVSGRGGLVRGYLPAWTGDTCVHRRCVYRAVWQRYLGLTIMRLVANGTDTRIPADVTTCKMAAAHDAALRSCEISTWTWSAISV